MVFDMDCEAKGPEKQQKQSSNNFRSADGVGIKIEMADKYVYRVEYCGDSEDGKDGLIIEISLCENVPRVVL